jgi:hypothetical protein
VEINKSSDFFKRLTTNPGLVENETITQLIAQYPYVSAFWFIKAGIALKKKDVNSKDYFQQAALLSPKPETLYRFVNQDRFNSELASQTELSLQNENLKDGEHQEEVVQQEETFQKPSLYNDDAMPYSFIWWLNKTRIDHAHIYQPYVQKGLNFRITKDLEQKDPLDQQMREHIFHIQSPELKLSDTNISAPVSTKAPKKENQIIDKFIKEEPKINPPAPEKVSLENKARKSAVDESGFVSETLARIYAEQGLHHKAIDTYKKLSLKYPEKSLYFAELIEQLEKQN